MSEHIDIRNKVKAVSTIERFENIINAVAITESDRQLMRMYYLDDQKFSFIGQELGYSESGAVKRHKKIIKKIANLPSEYF